MTSSRRQHTPVRNLARRTMSLEGTLGNTTCSKGHLHPPWNTTGVLSIAKCESVCGFCQKETKTAANLRKHVAIHIKNERLNLTIAEGSSGRGRLEMPTAPPLHSSERNNSISSSRMSTADDDEMSASDPSSSSISAYRRPSHRAPDSFSPSQVLMSMASQAASSSSSYPASIAPSYYTSHSHSTSPLPAFSSPSYAPSISHQIPPYIQTPHSQSPTPALAPDPFRTLREHHLTTRFAWTPIPASEGFRILDLCKSLSTTASGEGGGGGTEERVPCYNRETIFDEEWQAHMKDVHGVFLLWPETWMRRIEVLDLDAFGGDIGACNEVIMEG